MTIAVTGAAGKTGRAVLAALAELGVPTRALVRPGRPGSTSAVADLGATETVTADLADASQVAAALSGASAAYVIAPNVHPDEPSLVANVLAAGVPRVVYHSVLHPSVEAMPHHWAKARVEEALLASDLDWTVLQPCAYAQNLRVPADAVLRVPYSVDARFAFVDLLDVAAVAASVLTEPGHSYASYQLAGPELLSVADAAVLLGVRAERQNINEWYLDTPLRGYARDALGAMFAYYDEHGLVGNPRVITALLGRAPTAVADVLARASERPE
ncbi:SDR family oxidoreductase [Cryptosporangium minutisporangium]|uniref:NAD(P)H-binding protein n=1 Tax=Cryptosporangium minutisporangium TaxID=113569 RepID=A0ABP6SXQ6_9ACTN